MFAAAISLVGLAATALLCLARGQGHSRSVGHRHQKGAFARSIAFGLFQLFLTVWGAIGLVAQNEPLAFVMLILTNAIPHRLRPGQHRPRSHRPARLCVRQARRPRPHRQARPPARRLCGQTTRRRRPVPAARRRLCAAGHGGLVQPRPYGSTPCASCSSGPSSPCS